jgi:hypothetical protein
MKESFYRILGKGVAKWDVKFTNGVGGEREEKRKNRMATTAAPFATLFFFLRGIIPPLSLLGVWPSPSEFRVGEIHLKPI